MTTAIGRVSSLAVVTLLGSGCASPDRRAIDPEPRPGDIVWRERIVLADDRVGVYDHRRLEIELIRNSTRGVLLRVWVDGLEQIVDMWPAGSRSRVTVFPYQLRLVAGGAGEPVTLEVARLRASLGPGPR